MKKNVVILWCVLFLALLIAIPVFLAQGSPQLAKFSGAIFAALAVIAVVSWRGKNIRSKSKKSRIPLTVNDKTWLKENISFYAKLSKKNCTIFEDRMGLFLANNHMIENENEAPKEHKLMVAASAVMAFWGLPYFDYGQPKKVILLQEGSNSEWVDDDFAVNFTAIKNEFNNEIEAQIVPAYNDLLSTSTNADYEPMKFHQDLWTATAKKVYQRSEQENAHFFSELELYFYRHPEQLKVKHAALSNLLAQMK